MTDGDRSADLAIGRTCARLAADRQARDVKLLFVGDRLGIAEYFVLATVHNRRQARAVRDAVRLALKEQGWGVPIAASEDPEGRWSLYDYGGVVMHLFDDEGRRFFDLDAIWADVPRIPFEEDRPDGGRGRPSEARTGGEPDDPPTSAADDPPPAP